MVMEQPAALARPARERHRVAEVVAVDHVHRQAGGERRAQRLRADHVAAVDHRLRAGGLAGLDRGGERCGAVVAVGDDADLHAAIIDHKLRRRAAYGRISFARCFGCAVTAECVLATLPEAPR